MDPRDTPARPLAEQPFTVIHVGKCGGGSVAAELSKAAYRFDWIHVRKPPIQPSLRYVILIRDPVERFVSAFHWRKQLLSQQTNRLQEQTLQTMKQRFEHQLLMQFSHASEFAELVNPDDPTAGLHGGISLVQLIGHVPLGFAWYLDGLLDAVEPRQLVAAIAVESMAADMLSVFGIPISQRDKMNYPGKNTDLSTQGRRNLEQLFAGEYRTLQRLSQQLMAGGGHRPALLERLADAARKNS
jgi:hypothetical protein